MLLCSGAPMLSLFPSEVCDEEQANIQCREPVDHLHSDETGFRSLSKIEADRSEVSRAVLPGVSVLVHMPLAIAYALNLEVSEGRRHVSRHRT